MTDDRGECVSISIGYSHRELLEQAAEKLGDAPDFGWRSASALR